MKNNSNDNSKEENKNIEKSNEKNKKENNEENKEISLNDINYAIYKIGNWKNSYDINLIGDSNEIPVTGPTRDHVMMSMEEIRKATFEIEGKTVNGIVALATQLNDKVEGIAIDDLIAKEEDEYKNIINELNNLEFKDSNETINLDTNSYLIYKLEKENHVTVAKPANKFTENHHMEEIKKLQKNQKN